MRKSNIPFCNKRYLQNGKCKRNKKLHLNPLIVSYDKPRLKAMKQIKI